VSWNSGYQLRVREPGAKERIFSLEQKTVRVERSIGQIPSLKLLLLEDRAVSRRHATLKWQVLDQTFLLVHESKTNATLVNGESFRSILLAADDVIQMGDTKIRLESLGSEQKATGATAPREVRRQDHQEKDEPSSRTLSEKALEATPKAQPGKSERKSSEKFSWKPPEER
jgi:pSer/pThr/pTyr-binding forkhead associated (FHA) protein